MEFLQDVTEENAELALGVKANRGLTPPAAATTGKHLCSKFSYAVVNNALLQYLIHPLLIATLTVLHSTMAMLVSLCNYHTIDLLLSVRDAWHSGST